MFYPVFPGVTLIRLPWTQVWLLSKGRDATLIDCGTCRDRKRLLAALGEALPADFRLNSVLLTHGHCDHAGSAAFLGDHFNARIHAHSGEEPFFAARRTYIPHGLRALSPQGLAFALGEIFYPVERRSVDVLMADGDRVETPIGPLAVIHTPGHTPGHVVYYDEREGRLFSGDALLNVVPFVMRSGLSLPPSLFSSDMSGVRRSARRIAEMGPTALLAGHGWPHQKDTAAAIRAFIKCLPE